MDDINYAVLMPPPRAVRPRGVVFVLGAFGAVAATALVLAAVFWRAYTAPVPAAAPAPAVVSALAPPPAPTAAAAPAPDQAAAATPAPDRVTTPAVKARRARSPRRVAAAAPADGAVQGRRLKDDAALRKLLGI